MADSVIWIHADTFPPPPDPLEAQARKLWPDDMPHAQHNRRQWIAAVRLVRGTKRGWVADTLPHDPAGWPSVETQ